MTSLDLDPMMYRAFSFVTLSFEEAERSDLVVVMGCLLSYSRYTRGDELPLHSLLGLRTVQGRSSTISSCLALLLFSGTVAFWLFPFRRR